MQELLAMLVAFFLVQPLQAATAETLAAAGAPRALVAQVAACAERAAPVILERAAADPWWAARSAFAVWTGLTPADRLLVEAAPGCAPAVEAARPFLGSRES